MITVGYADDNPQVTIFSRRLEKSSDDEYDRIYVRNMFMPSLNKSKNRIRSEW